MNPGFLLSIITSSLLFLYSCENPNNKHSTFNDTTSKQSVTTKEPIKPIHLPIVSIDKVELGKQLFHDTRLSKTNKISCASCHNLETGGVDQEKFSKGIHDRLGNINTPTVYNSSQNFKQFWDGRADNLLDQIDGPIHNPNEMGMDWNSITSILEKDNEYQTSFNRLYEGGISSENIKDAIAEFEKSLVTPSRFDRFLEGDYDAISESERHGYQLFKEYGCSSCHQGKNVGGNMFQKLGIVKHYFSDTSQADYGRFNLTKDEADMFVFKVPSLRNVALTAPYLHNGKAQTLEEVIQIMAEYQLGRIISKEEVKLIESFLQSLTGEELEPSTTEILTQK
ncbi:cytochrome-c peroxidase [Sediminitomix flava]|uniref:Cytochrome c peroxidase n=1 Tax=Sediminitomix flava TaxID=379075 RepID=A0A315Z6B3_SEDFL|nr:cytochrome c peroxidase [Sediminitomix flava]PWJ39252.1 cytochrome c peroxidase [Sediminitomix flava]